jgi:phosphopantothenoylcysteine synthetase/decarboxylase
MYMRDPQGLEYPHPYPELGILLARLLRPEEEGSMAERNVDRDDEVIADQNDDDVTGIDDDELADEVDDDDEEDEDEEDAAEERG